MAERVRCPSRQDRLGVLTVHSVDVRSRRCAWVAIALPLEEPGIEVQELRRDVQQVIQESQESLLDSMKNMVVDFTRTNGQSESGGAEGSARVGEGPVGVAPARDAGVGPILRAGDSGDLGALGQSDTRGQPDQPGRNRGFTPPEVSLVVGLACFLPAM